MTNENDIFGDGVDDRGEARPEREQENRDEGRARSRSGGRQRDGDEAPRRDSVEAFFGGASRTQFGGISNKTLNALIEVFDNIDRDFDDPNVDPALARKKFAIHPIDSVNTNPTLVIGLPVTVAGEEQVIHYSLVLEIPGVQMREIRRSRRDEPLQLPVFSEDRMDSRWAEAVAAAVGRIGAGHPVDAGWQLIPSNMLVEDTNEGTVRDDLMAIFSNAVDAICGWREILAEQSGEQIPAVRLGPDFVEKDFRHFEARLDYSRKPRFDTSKLPIRSDIALSVYHTELPRGREDERLVPTSRPIGTVSIAVDMVVSSDNEVSGWGRRRSREDDQDPFWQPIINITDIVGEQNIPWSIENSLLMLGATSILANDFRWVEGLRQRPGSQYKSLEDLSVLTLAHPDPARRGVSEDITPNTGDAELSDYLNCTTRPSVYYGMVLAAGSEKGWANSIFERIALAEDVGDRNHLLAMLYDACDNLTGNKFGKLMAAEGIGRREAPVFTTDNRVFTGYFTDENGNARDIREWNVPSILALTKDNPADAYDIAMQYQDTLMADAGTELSTDLAERFRILEQLLGANAFHLNGTAEMIQVESWFVTMLAAAMVESGVMPRISDHNGLRARSHRTSSYRGDAIERLETGRRRRDDDFDRRDRGRGRSGR